MGDLDGAQSPPSAPTPSDRGSVSKVTDDDFEDRALFCLHRGNKFRELCIWIYRWPWFDRFILITILVNCITMACDGQPTRMPDKTGARVLTPQWILGFEGAYFWIYLFEFVVKVVAMGFIQGEKTYMQNPTNILDFVVVAASVFEAIMDLLKLSSGSINLKPIRAVRMLRPLKAVKQLDGMSVIIATFSENIMAMSSVLSFFLFVLFVLAVVAINFVSCTLRHRCWDLDANDCVGGDCSNMDYMCGTTSPMFPGWNQCPARVCGGVEYKPWESFGSLFPVIMANKNFTLNATMSNFMNGGYYTKEGCNVVCSDQVFENRNDATKIGWKSNPNFYITHFDNVASAFLTIFQCVTLEGWTDIMYVLQDACGHFASFFQVFCVIAGSMVVLSVLLAVIEGSYSDKAAEEEDAELNEKRAQIAAAMQQREDEARARGEVIQKKEVVRKTKEELDQEKYDARNKLYAYPPLGRFVETQAFDSFIMMAIILNALVMALSFDPRYEPQRGMEIFQYWANNVFNAIFLVELCLKMIGLGPALYFSQGANCFDFFIVFLSIFNFTTNPLPPGAENASGGPSIPGAAALRALRALRLLKLLRKIESVMELIMVIINSLGNIRNVTILLVLIMFIFALIGMAFFGGNLTYDDLGGLPRSHFDTIGFAFLTIFQILTGENWNEVMYNCMGIDTTLAKDNTVFDGKNWGALMASIYFIMVNFIGQMVVLNLFLAVLLGSFGGKSKPGVLDIVLVTTAAEEDEIRSRIKGGEEWQDVPVTADNNECDAPAEQNHSLFVWDDAKQTATPAKLWFQYGYPEEKKRNPVTGEECSEEDGGEDTPTISHLKIWPLAPNDNGEYVLPWHGKNEAGEDGDLDDTEEVVVEHLGILGPHVNKPKDAFGAGMRCCLVASREDTAPVNFLVFANGARDAELLKTDFTPVNVDDRAVAVSKDDKDGQRPNTTPLLRPASSAIDDSGDVDSTYLFICNDRSGKQQFETTISWINNRPLHHVHDEILQAEEMYLKTMALTNDAGSKTSNQVSPAGNASNPIKSNSGESVEGKLLQRLIPQPLTQDQRDKDLGHAFCCIKADNKMRAAALALVQSQRFDNFIMLCIAVGTVCLAYDEPVPIELMGLEATNNKTMALGMIDLILTIIFIVEMLAKWLAFGFIFGPQAYWQGAWNILDGTVVAISCVTLPMNPWVIKLFSSDGDSGMSSLTALKALRAFRALRPLRAVSRLPDLKLIVSAIIKSLPAVTSALMIFFAFLMIFSIMGVQVFAGRFDYCECTFNPVNESHPDFEYLHAQGGLFDTDDGTVMCPSWYKQPTVFPYLNYMGYSAVLPLADALKNDGEVGRVNGAWVISDDGIRLTRSMCISQDGKPYPESEWKSATRAFSDPQYTFKYEGSYTTIEPPLVGSDQLLGNHTFQTKWVDRYNGLTYNCDELFSCMFTLFEVSTLEGWLDVMYSGMDGQPQELNGAVGPFNVQPERNDLNFHTMFVAFFFILFILVCSFLFLNLFVGVIIDNFNDQKSQSDGSVFMTSDMSDWIHTLKAIHSTPAAPKLKRSPRATTPNGGLITQMRQICFNLWWDVDTNDEKPLANWFIMIVIMLNTLTMALAHCGSEFNKPFTDTIAAFGLVYNIIYTVEMATKHMGFGVRAYWSERWNQFDGTIVIFTWLGVIVSASSGGGGNAASFITLLRVLRVARVAKLLKKFKTVKQTIVTLIMSMASLMWVIVLLVLFMFIFAALGMNLFNGIKFNGVLDRHANFNSLGSSFSLMMRFSTGEYWNGIQHALSIQPDYDNNGEDACDPTQAPENWGNWCGPTPAPAIFFTVYTFMIQIIMVNLFIAVILEKFAENEASDTKLSPAMVDEFNRVWVRGDPNGDGFQNADAVSEIVKRLPHYWTFKLFERAGINKPKPDDENNITYSNRPYGKFSRDTEPNRDEFENVIPGTETEVTVDSSDSTYIRWLDKGTHVEWLEGAQPELGGSYAISEVLPGSVTVYDSNGKEISFKNPPLNESPFGGLCGKKKTAGKDKNEKHKMTEPTADICCPSRQLTTNECLKIARLLNVSPDRDTQKISYNAALTAFSECQFGKAIPEYVEQRSAEVQKRMRINREQNNNPGAPMEDVSAAVMVQKVFRGRKARQSCVFKMEVNKDPQKSVRIVKSGMTKGASNVTWTSPPDEPRVNFEGNEYIVQWLEALPLKPDGKQKVFVKVLEDAPEMAKCIEYEGRLYAANWRCKPPENEGPFRFTVDVDEEHVQRARRAAHARKDTKDRHIGGRIQRIVTLHDEQSGDSYELYMPLAYSWTVGPHTFKHIDITKSRTSEGQDFAHVNGVVTLSDGSQFRNPCKREHV